MIRHAIIPNNKVHVPYSFIFNNATERLSTSGFSIVDKYKISLQLDTKTLWMLTNPNNGTWLLFGSQITTTGLSMYYTMDNVSGSTLISETGVYNGSISGATIVNDRNTKVLNLDGNDYVTVSRSLWFGNPGLVCTVSGWFKGSGLICGNNNVSTIAGYGYLYLASNYISYQAHNTTGAPYTITFDYTFPTPIDTTKWNYVAFVKSGASSAYYINGLYYSFNGAFSSTMPACYAFTIGKYQHRNFGLSYFNGRMDNFRFYDTALNKMQLDIIYARD